MYLLEKYTELSAQVIQATHQLQVCSGNRSIVVIVVLLQDITFLSKCVFQPNSSGYSILTR